MAWFRRKSPEVIRRGTDNRVVEENKVVEVDGHRVEVRRVAPAPKKTARPTKQRARRPRPTKGGRRNGPPTKVSSPSSTRGTRTHARPSTRASRDNRRGSYRPSPPALIVPPDSGRNQMLVRVRPHQTQVVVLDGPVLVEHHVTRSDTSSVIGNIYLGKVQNVLPGMEAAFVDFGGDKNGVLYASELMPVSNKNRNTARRIENVLKPDDSILVQVTKDAMNSKGARLTGTPALTGRHLVLVPNSDAEGISRRLPESERTRLRQILRDNKPTGYGIIVRTAALRASAEEIKADIDRLLKQWKKINTDAKQGSVPRLIHQEPDLLIRVIREHFGPRFRRMLIDDESAHQAVVEYLESTSPHLVAKVSHYQDELPLFERFHVEDQLRKALERRVFLPSGGHLVIDRTEAMTVIDVNTGRFVGSSSLEETVLQNNLEAADEIARQLRLRDIGGIIVIDFIDMDPLKHQRQVLHRLRQALAKDRTRTQVFEVSNLGLVEMTRKNVSAGLLETFSHQCDHCQGRGIILHEEAAALAVPYETLEDSVDAD